MHLKITLEKLPHSTDLDTMTNTCQGGNGKARDRQKYCMRKQDGTSYMIADAIQDAGSL